MNTPPLRILSFGAGAIGTYIGGSLALSGQQVVFLEHPEVAADLRQRGLKLNLNGQEQVIPSPIMANSIEEAFAQGDFDVALFALKSYDTRAALENLKNHQQAMPPILCLQNGIENEPAIESILGSGKAIPGTVTSAIGRQAAGNIVLERLRGMGVAASHPLSEKLVRALNQAGLNARLYPHATSMKWSKMLTNLISNATSAILNMTPAEVFAHPGLYRLEIAQLRETLGVMHKLGVAVVDLPATPVRLLAFGVQALPLAISRPLLTRAVGTGRGGKMPSFHIDLHSGRSQSEVDYLNGAIVRQGELTGIPTPVNRLLNETLLTLTRSEADRNAYDHQPQKLLALWK